MMPNFTKDKDDAILWARQIMEQEFLVLDTETTGLGHDDETVAIGLVNRSGVVLVDTLLRHTKPNEPGAEAVHGITWEMTREAPALIDVWPRLEELLKQNKVIGYNLSFDRRILTRTARRFVGVYCDIEGALRDASDHDDVMPQFAAFYGDWHDYFGSYTWQKLTVAAAFFGLDTGGAHSAAADALLTLEIVKRMATTKTFREAHDGPN